MPVDRYLRALMSLLELVVAGGWETWIIPLVSAFVGWWTNAVAVKMMFAPKEFVGIKPYLGWQGIVPAAAMGLASKASKLILGQVMTVRDLFAGFDAERMTKQLGPALDRWTDDILADTVTKLAPELWASMAEPARASVRAMLRSEIELTARDMLAEVHQDVDKIFDLRQVMMTNVAENRDVVSDIFLTVGKPEFRFIELSGLYFGLPLGVLQMLLWAAFPIWWTLPVAGFLVGYATNWFALKLIFHPQRPSKVGPFTVQGLFHKRQREVARAYANTIAERVLNPESVVKTITSGEHGALLFGIVRKHVTRLLDKYEKGPFGAMISGERAPQLRDALFVRMESEIGKPGGFLYQFVERAMDIKGELFARMDKLDPANFEGVLRPAFQQDEWKLIVVGGVLGLAAGFVQLVTCFSQVWSAVSF
jgi:uncharacterized membrane protein YheB (UPF0754 family)